VKDLPGSWQRLLGGKGCQFAWQRTTTPPGDQLTVHITAADQSALPAETHLPTDHLYCTQSTWTPVLHTPVLHTPVLHKMQFHNSECLWTSMDSFHRFQIKQSHCASCCKSTDWLSCGHTLCPTRHKTGHFGDVFRSQSLGSVWKKKTKPNTTKARIHQSKEMYYDKIYHVKKQSGSACCRDGLVDFLMNNAGLPPRSTETIRLSSEFQVRMRTDM